MKRRFRSPSFEATLDHLRAHSYSVASFAGVAGGTIVCKHGVAAVLVTGKVAPLAFAVRPGVLVGREIARLVDRGYQKFIQTSGGEVPATASQLHAIHLFSEELKQLLGAISFYNDSLGTTSDLYQYDRLKGREAVQLDSSQSGERPGEH